MEDLCAALSGGFKVGEEHDSATSSHPRFAQFKEKHSSNDQTARRERALAVQKEKRKAKVDELRNLDDSGELEEDNEQMEVGRPPGKFYKRPYKNLIMLNEWMDVVPDDLEENWVFFICPVGRRSLLVAKRGKTMSFSRSGALRNTFHSLLPAGSRSTFTHGFSLLDSIYVEATRSYYCFDALVWNRLDLRDMDTDFRNCFMLSRLQEVTGDIEQQSSQNPCPIHPVQMTLCTRENLRQALDKTYPFEVDGIMFYHKEALYTSGAVSPLGCWLKPHMVGQLIFDEPVEADMTSEQVSDSHVTSGGDSEDQQPIDTS